jgi:hypothetical protein
MHSAVPAEQEWERFEADLASCLRVLEEDEYLIISSKLANHYVQFAAQGQFGMRMEAACDTYILPPEACLTTEDYATMHKLGWNGATMPPPELLSGPPPADGSPNFFVDASFPVDCAAAAALAVKTLRLVYGIRHPGLLEYKAFARGGNSIRFPTLRIKRRSRQVEEEIGEGSEG